MSFAGHESFHVREGWLSRALSLVIHQPEVYLDQNPEDYIGVGRNMYKSIRYWLIATGLVEGKLVRKGASQSLEATWLGKQIAEVDPHFLSPITWWILHINLVNNPSKSVVWSWFFNSWKISTFEKGRCQNSFSEFVKNTHKKMPRLATLEKDLSVLINSYSVKLNEAQADPEDTSDSPFQELELLKFQRNTNSYLLNTNLKRIPHALIGYSMWSAKNFRGKESQKSKILEDVSIEECASILGGPGACFVMNPEKLYQCIHEEEGKLLKITGLAGSRAIKFSQKYGKDWIAEAFEAEKGMVQSV
jgi:hypothetical protein